MMNLTRREAVKAFTIGPLAVLALAETGCVSITTTLELIITTTGAAVDIAFPQYAGLLNPYFTAVTTFIDETNTELASTDTAAVKASKIAGFAAAIVLPNLSGVAAQVVADIEKIGPLISQLIAEVQGLSAAIDATPGGATAFFAAHKKIKPPSAKDTEKIRKKNAALKAKLAAHHSAAMWPWDVYHVDGAKWKVRYPTTRQSSYSRLATNCTFTGNGSV
jgi:hypothetical protein